MPDLPAKHPPITSTALERVRVGDKILATDSQYFHGTWQPARANWVGRVVGCKQRKRFRRVVSRIIPVPAEPERE